MATAVSAHALSRAPHTTHQANATKVSAKHFRVASGITLWHTTFVSLSKHRENATLMNVDLKASGVRLSSISPNLGVGFKRQTVLAVAHKYRAVGGINGDFFDLHSTKAVPRGGVVRSGHITKTPRPYWRANLYVTPKGKAGIGPMKLIGQVSRGTRGGTAYPRAHRVFSVNTVFDAQKGRITYVNTDLASTSLGKSCTVAYGSIGKSGRVITRVVSHLTYLHRLTGSGFALVACGGTAEPWLKSYLLPGDAVSVPMQFDKGAVQTLISGGRVLIQHGKAFNDVGGEVIAHNPPNPETFACVSGTGRYVLLGTVDGRMKSSGGVNYKELTAFLLHQHCYSALSFDGGGSTTLVARTPGHKTAVVQNKPSEGTLRPIPNGLYVFGH